MTPARTAIVTGAARGIGAGIARRLCRAGMNLALLDLDAMAVNQQAGHLREAGGRVESFPVDVGDEAAVVRAVDAVARSLGPPLVLVNNAGFARDAPLEDSTAANLDDVLRVVLRGSWLLTRAVTPYMKTAGWGRVIQISSTSARGHADRAGYCAAKAGLDGLTRSLAHELGPCGITVNVVAPGLIVTRMTEATARRRGLTLDDHLTDAVSRIPVRRPGRPEDIGALVAFLAGDDAGFISVQTIYVAGGPV